MGAKTVLIAEGDDRVAELFADLFALEGWTVARYTAGQRAIDALAGSAPYDAVLVNNRLNGMSGVELIARIRALAHRKNVPIVMVTGSTDVALRRGLTRRAPLSLLQKRADRARGAHHRWRREDHVGTPVRGLRDGVRDRRQAARVRRNTCMANGAGSMTPEGRRQSIHGSHPAH